MTDIVVVLRALSLRTIGEEAASEIERLRGALEAIRNTSGYDNILFTGASAAICSRMANIHQHADSALPPSERGAHD